ncbi:unnamed protein product, partial [Hapterophycus canaliculatus]
MLVVPRYAEVPGSGYRKLERTRCSSPLPTPPSLPAPADFALPVPTAASISSSSSSPASSVSLPSAAASSSPLTSSPPRQQQQQHEAPASPDLSQMGSPMGSNASLKSSKGDNNTSSSSSSSSSNNKNSNNINNNGSVPTVSVPGRFSDPVGLLPADDFRNQRFKLIPSVVSGPFIVRKAVGNKPALLGRKVSQRYFRGPGYVETDV